MNLASKTNTELFRIFVQENSKEAINIFFQNQMDLFYRVAFKYTKNSADAEDVLQAAFMSIMATAHQYKGLQTDEEKLLQSWCLSVVVHCSLMKIRTDSNRRNRETNYSVANAKPFYEENTMERTNENEIVHQKVKNAIFQLPEKYRIPIHLKYVEGFELDTIANILKLNANTLRSLIKRGLEKVSVQLKEENVTLSSTGLIGLIQTWPMEKAPFAFHEIASKITATTKSSQPLLVTASSKSALLNLKILIYITISGLILVTGFYVWSEFHSKQVAPIPPAFTIKAETETNQTWDFAKESDRAVTLLEGQWEWSESQKGMEAPINTTVLISLPIVPQKKAFLIKFDMVSVNNKELIKHINFNSFWVRNNLMLKHDFYLSKDIYKINPGSVEKSFMIYYYNGYLCNFINGKCYQINKYSQDLEGANISIGAQNFIFRKISSKTFDIPPDELLKAIQEPPSTNSVKHEDRPFGKSND